MNPAPLGVGVIAVSVVPSEPAAPPSSAYLALMKYVASSAGDVNAPMSITRLGSTTVAVVPASKRLNDVTTSITAAPLTSAVASIRSVPVLNPRLTSTD
jgi:hypothetical protein